jgi:UDP-glucose 4-epimerase
VKYLVTGGCGFIGSNLVDRLVRDDHEVVVIDSEIATENRVFYKNDKATYHKLCITNYEDTVALYKGVDCVFHLAARSRIQRCIQSPLETCRVNFLGTSTVLECSRVNNVRRVVFSSTSSIYGGNKELPLKESMTPNPLNPYSVSKLSAEMICKNYSQIYGLDTAILRYFNVYGNREPEVGQYAPVVGLFIRNFKNGNPLTVVGDGEQTRDFTLVDDVVNANILACINESNLNGRIFNIGSGTNYSIISIARYISNNIQFIPTRVGEAQHTLADIENAKVTLNYNPTGNIFYYINSMIGVK